MNDFIFYITIVLISGILVSRLADRLRIADVVLLLLLGVILGPEVLDILPAAYINAAGETIRELALIIIVFDAGYHISWRILKKEWLEVTKFVTIGCVFIMAVSAFFAKMLFGIPYSLALLVGAIVSATDPSATLSMLSGKKISEKVKDTLEAESIVNDPTGIILTFVVFNALISPNGMTTAMYTGLVWMFAASFVAGIAGGFLSAIIMRHIMNYSVLFSVSIATATYMLSNLVGGSGIFAVAIAGAMLGHQSIPNKRTIVQFDDEIAALMKIGVFVYLGAIIRLELVAATLIPGVIFAIILLFIARPAMILILASSRKFTLKERLYMGLLGPIGVVPAALAPLLLAFPMGDKMVGVIFTTIVVSLVIVGLMLEKYNKALLEA